MRVSGLKRAEFEDKKSYGMVTLEKRLALHDDFQELSLQSKIFP